MENKPAGILKTRDLELLGQPGLFQHGIGGVTGFYPAIDGEAKAGNRAKPYFMIALAGSFEAAIVFTQNLF